MIKVVSKAERWKEVRARTWIENRLGKDRRLDTAFFMCCEYHRSSDKMCFVTYLRILLYRSRILQLYISDMNRNKEIARVKRRLMSQINDMIL